MEIFRDYDVEKCKRYHYTTLATSVYYALYNFIDDFLTHDEKCAEKTISRFNLYLTCMQVISYSLTSLLIIKSVMTNSLDTLTVAMLVFSIILMILISFIPSITLPKFNNLDITLIALKGNLKTFIWILGFTKFNEHKTWRESSISNRLFKLIIERIKYSCTLSGTFNKCLHEWIDQYLVFKDLTPSESSEKLKHLISLNDTDDELIRILRLVMVTEINDIAIMFNKSDDSTISEELENKLNRCREAWKRSLQLLLVNNKSIFTSKPRPNKTLINELISTVSNGLYEIEDKFAPITDKQFTTKSYRKNIMFPKNNFNDSLTAF